MRQIFLISKRELKSFFDSLTAYILIVVFLAFSGFFTWLYGTDIFFIGQASLQPFFAVSYWSIFFFIPSLTMKMIAEEKRNGTLELILTKPITDWQFIFGKFFACLFLILITLAFTLPYYFSVWFLGPVDHGAVFAAYLGTILMSMSLIGIGLFASSVTNNQIVAFLISIFIGVFFVIIFEMLSGNHFGFIGYLLDFLSINSHYNSISRGVIDSRDIIYFFVLTFIGLYLSKINLSKRNF